MPKSLIPGSSIHATSSVNLVVGLAETVAIFVSRHEEALYDAKAILNGKLTELNIQIDSIISDARKAAKQEMTNALEAHVFDNPFFNQKVFFKETDAIPVNFEKKVVTFTLYIETMANDRKQQCTGYVTYNMPTWTVHNNRYAQAIKEKTAVLGDLRLVTTEIADIGRNERKARAFIATQQLNAAGLHELATSQPLELPKLATI